MLPTVPSVASVAQPMNNDDRAWWRYKAGRRNDIISRTLCTWMSQSPCRSITTSVMTATSLTYWTHSSIRGAYLSQSRAKKNTNAMQYVLHWNARYRTMLPCYQAKTWKVSFIRFSSTVNDSGNNVASVPYDSIYTRMRLAHAHPFIWSCEQNCSSHRPGGLIIIVVSLKWWMEVYMLDASVPFPATTVPVVEPMYENKRWNPPSQWRRRIINQNHLSCIV